MKVAISANKLFTFFYWALYLGLCFSSGWFASGVVENYLSRKTSFSQYEETSIKRPVISIIMSVSEKKILLGYETHIIIQYCPSYKTWATKCKNLELCSYGPHESTGALALPELVNCNRIIGSLLFHPVNYYNN